MMELLHRRHRVYVCAHYVIVDCVQATVRCLADNGRLLEIGKYDILKGTPLSMRPMLRNVAFEGIDLDRITNDPSNITEVGTLGFITYSSKVYWKYTLHFQYVCWYFELLKQLDLPWFRHGRCTRC